MANWVENWLTILVPRDKRAEFLAAIEGPMDWITPELPWDHRQRPDLSNHQKLEIQQNAEELVQKFRELYKDSSRPDWMPVSRTDIERMVADGEIDIPETVPFSVPRILPLKDIEEFNRLFPGSQNGPFWEHDESREDDYHNAKYGGGRLCRGRTGGTGLLFDVTLAEENNPGNANEGYASILLRYNTKWKTLGNLYDVLTPLLIEFGAKALLLWEEEQGFTGYEYINPFDDRVMDEEFDLDSQFMVEDEPDEDGYAHRYVNRQAFEEYVHEAIEDTDFVNRF